MNSVTYHPADLDDDTISDFVDSLRDELEDVSSQLLTLEREPTNKEVINALFRSVHSIKGNCRMCFLEPFSHFVHAVEEALSEMRNGRIPFSTTLGEAVSMSLDHLKVRAEELLRNRKTEVGLLEEAIPSFARVKSASVADIDALMEHVIRIYAGEVGDGIELRSPPLSASTLASEATTPADYQGDISFFSDMAQLIDSTTPHWDKRSVTQLSIAIGINEHLPRKVDANQLTVAIYLHDLGMKFLPQDLVNKNQKFNPLEEKRVREHVIWSYEWTRRMPAWQPAADMVLQHHERPDGNGYPQGLKGDHICDGAQIIAIADAFFALTNERSDRTYKKSLMRAITEINSYRDVQFKGNVVDAFNGWIRDIYKKQA